MELDLFTLILTMISLPLQLMQYLIGSIGDFVVFDVLNLGPYLPISLNL